MSAEVADRVCRWMPTGWTAAALICAASPATGAPLGVECAPVADLGAQPGAPPAAPSPCRTVTPDAPLAEAIARAGDGDALCLAPGTYDGPVVLDRAITLWGPRSAVIRPHGRGSTVSIAHAFATVLGVTVDARGSGPEELDPAIRVSADDVRVEGLRVLAATPGIAVERAHRVALVRNEVQGSAEPSIGMRGDSIRLWETYDSLVDGNVVESGRDVLVWYSPRNRVVGNRVSGGRYGTHLMYSSDVVLERNVYERNTVGVFVMYGRNLRVERNVFAESAGAAGIGLGLKEAGNLVATDNVFVGDTIGTYFDTSPLDLDDTNVFERNAYRLDGTAVVFHGGQRGNAFVENAFRDNRTQVAVEGRSDASGTRWDGNYFDDYAGYDLSGDGVGDVPYELRSLSGELIGRFPELELFRGTPALALVDAIGKLVPLYEPTLVLSDPHPRMKAPRAGTADAH